MALSNQKKRALAERMFIEDGDTAKYISEFLTVSEQTLSRWRKGRTGESSWDDRRAENLSAPHKLKEILTKQLQIVAEGGQSTIDADALAKISRVLQDVSSKTSVQVVLSVLKEFDTWMAEQEPELAIDFLKWHKKFIIHKASMQ
ncbi:MAG: hypothetical protein PSN34_06330 [Urechidicola sp.]|nr:hypothetical protein [Urechidicola sp.]